MKNDKLMKKRHERGLTQAEIAEQVGIRTRLYQAYEYNEKRPNVETALKIANALGCRVEDIFNLPRE